MTTAQFFESVSFQQRVNSESGEQVLDLLKADDFFRLLAQRGIRKKANDHANLRQFLQLSPQYPDVLVVRTIRMTLEQMADNEDFMNAIREDIMAAQEEEAYHAQNN